MSRSLCTTQFATSEVLEVRWLPAESRDRVHAEVPLCTCSFLDLEGVRDAMEQIAHLMPGSKSQADSCVRSILAFEGATGDQAPWCPPRHLTVSLLSGSS